MNYHFVFLITLGLILFTSKSYADELIIKLKSGNAIKVNFLGTIRGVEMISGTDSIENLHIITDITQREPSPPQEITKSTKDSKQTDTSKSESNTKDKEQRSKDREMRIRIAPPIFGE